MNVLSLLKRKEYVTPLSEIRLIFFFYIYATIFGYVIDFGAN